MRESAQAMRQGQAGDPKASGSTEDLARALDKVAERLGAATGERDSETARLSEQLSRTQELRDRLTELQRTMEQLQEGAQGAEAQRAQNAQNAQGASTGREGSSGQQGSSPGGRDLARLQRQADEQMREAQKLAEGVQRENPEMKGGTTPEQWQRSVSAPGTEGFKQDFAKWESLKNNLMVALEKAESQLSDQLRARETRERLNAGRHDGVADTYRELVDRYYQSLAAPRRQNR
jgi:hypothetical protein